VEDAAALGYGWHREGVGLGDRSHEIGAEDIGDNERAEVTRRCPRGNDRVGNHTEAGIVPGQCVPNASHSLSISNGIAFSGENNDIPKDSFELLWGYHYLDYSGPV
jgi:hypothetical protein